MAFGQSIVIAEYVSTLAGTLAGEYASKCMEEAGIEDRFILATGVALVHISVKVATGYSINIALGVDVTGAVVTTVSAPATGIAQGLCEFLKDIQVEVLRVA